MRISVFMHGLVTGFLTAGIVSWPGDTFPAALFLALGIMLYTAVRNFYEVLMQNWEAK